MKELLNLPTPVNKLACVATICLRADGNDSQEQELIAALTQAEVSLTLIWGHWNRYFRRISGRVGARHQVPKISYARQ